jgi:hypothetical protein
MKWWHYGIQPQEESYTALPFGQEKVYNIDEAGILLSVLTSRKAQLRRKYLIRCSGAGLKRMLATADGMYLCRWEVS